MINRPVPTVLLPSNLAISKGVVPEPTTCSELLGLVVPTPTLLFAASTLNVEPSILKPFVAVDVNDSVLAAWVIVVLDDKVPPKVIFGVLPPEEVNPLLAVTLVTVPPPSEAQDKTPEPLVVNT